MSIVKRTLCTLPNCHRPYYAKGLCVSHYRRRQRGRDDVSPIRVMDAGGTCKFCKEKAVAKGMCKIHYLRVRRGTA
jgi:hypothetical protein